MYNNRNISSDLKKVIRERLKKKRIKEDEKKHKKEECQKIYT